MTEIPRSGAWRARAVTPLLMLALCGSLVQTTTGCSDSGAGPCDLAVDRTSDGSGGGRDPVECSVESGGNLLVIVIDDVGVDKIAAYGEHPQPARTPHIDALAGEGVLFRRAWVNPTCSPTRSSLLTGRHPTQTGLGRWIAPDQDPVDLALSEVTIPEMLRRSAQHAYSSAAVGKWHLVSWGARASPGTHPLLQGFAGHAGSLANPRNARFDYGLPLGFFRWEKNVDGALGLSNVYMTTDTASEAPLRIGELAPPWFLWVAFNATHTPLHVPPAALATPPQGDTKVERYDAMVEALDAEIGRLLDGIPAAVRDETTVLLIGDNGTPKHGISPPWPRGRSKGTLYEGGVRVPLIVAGPYVGCRGCETNALVQGTDLFATAAQIAGVDLAEVRFEEGPRAGAPVPVDSLSLLPHACDPERASERDLLFSEHFWPNGPGPHRWRGRAVRTAHWKYVLREVEEGPRESLFCFERGAIDEGEDLLAAGALDPAASDQLARLQTALAEKVLQLD